MLQHIRFIGVTWILFGILIQANGQVIEKNELQAHIKYLSSDKLEGRATGTKGEAEAAAYIVKNLEKLKEIQPKGTEGWHQPFSFTQKAHPHDTIGMGERKGNNVVAWLDNDAEYTIVIGAHYDHLGLGHDHNSMDANPEGKIHNGADDNASGSAGVLALAKYYASNNKKEKFNFLFIWFSGEELGLYGSKYYCDNPTIELEKVNYMINLDMIGRLNDETNSLVVHGVGTSPSWGDLLETVKGDFVYKFDSSGIGPSDHTSFYLKDVPVVFFFTGLHTDYHKPSDDWDLVNYEGEQQILDLIARMISETEAMPKLAFTKTKVKETKKVKYKVTMGVMPDYTFNGKGMKIDGVTEGRPAQKAGIQGGDVLIKIGEHQVESMMDYMTALGKIEKGSTLEATILRDGKELTVPVTFEE